MPVEQVRLDPAWPPGRPFQVIGLGLNAVDWICRLPHYPEHNSKVRIEQLERLGGGQVATATALCARYGLRCRYIGRVGDDEAGRFSLESLRTEPMDLSCVEVVPGASSQVAFILVDRPTGERTILWHRDPSLLYRTGDLKREWITEGQLLHLDGHDQPASIEAARWARQAGMRVSLDLDKVQEGVEELIALADFAMTSEGFVCELTGRDWRSGLLELAWAEGPLLGVTRGREGSAVCWQGEILTTPGYRVEALDTTGAGDVFHGAFIFGLFQNWNLGRILRFANAAGALAATRLGARAGIPPLSEVLSLAGE